MKFRFLHTFFTYAARLSRCITPNAHNFLLRVQVTIVATLRMGEHLLRKITYALNTRRTSKPAKIKMKWLKL